MYSWHLRLAATNLRCCRQSWSLLCCRLGQLETGCVMGGAGGWRKEKRGEGRRKGVYTLQRNTLPQGYMHAQTKHCASHIIALETTPTKVQKLLKWSSKETHRGRRREVCIIIAAIVGPLMYHCYRGFHVHCLVSRWCSSSLHLCASFEPFCLHNGNPCAFVCTLEYH